MKSKKILILLLVALIVLIGGASVLYDRLGQENAPDQLTEQTPTAPQSTQEGTADGSQPGEKPLAPDFTVYDREGNPVRLSDYFGKPIVLNFWASWCGPCRMEMPEFDAKYQQLAGEVEFLMVNMTDGARETVEIASRLVEQEGYSFPVLYDTDSHAATVYGVYSLPTTYFIDADGCAVAQATGALDGQTLQRGIDMITE